MDRQYFTDPVPSSTRWVQIKKSVEELPRRRCFESRWSKAARLVLNNAKRARERCEFPLCRIHFAANLLSPLSIIAGTISCEDKLLHHPSRCLH